MQILQAKFGVGRWSLKNEEIEEQEVNILCWQELSKIIPSIWLYH